MTSPVDTMYVDIQAINLDDFERAVRRGVSAALRDVDRDVEKATRGMEDDFDHAADEVERRIKLMGASTSKEATTFRKAWTKAAIGMATELEVAAEVGEHSIDDLADSAVRDLHRIEREAVKTGATLAASLAAGAAGAGAGLGGGGSGGGPGGLLSSLAGLGGQFRNIGALLPSPFIALIAAAIPLIIALVGALADLVGVIALLPAGFTFAVSALVPLIIAFRGFGEAVAAVASGDVEKINEAMYKLAPAARSVVREIGRILPELRGFGIGIQNAFFTPLKGVLTELARALLPELKVAMPPVAKALGVMAAALARVFADPRNVYFLAEGMKLTASVIERAAPIVSRFVDILFLAAHEALPFLERALAFVGRGFKNMSDAIGDAAVHGGIDRFIEDAFSTLKDLLDLGDALLDFFIALFGGADDEGRELIKTLTAMTRELTAFLQSPEGRDSLQKLIDLIPFLIGFLRAAAYIIGFIIVTQNNWFNALKAVPGALATAGKAIASFGVMIWHWLVDAWNTAFEAVRGFITRAIDAVTRIPGQVGQALSALPGLLLELASRAFDQLLHAIGVGIGLLLFAFTELPGLIINALVALPPMLATFFTNLWNGAVNITRTSIEAIINFVTLMVTRTIEFAGRLPGIIGDFFARTWNSAREATVRGIESVVTFVRNLPGRLRELGQQFIDAGRRLITGFLNGLSGTGEGAFNLGQKIVSAIKGLLNKVIDKVNSGIADIDNVLPGNLPRIPRLATGGYTVGAPLAQLHPNELVVPLGDQRALEAIREAGLGGGDTHVVFGENSINISFAGVTPTAQEACTVGQSVAEGIAGTLARRNIRVAVRMM